MKDSPALLPLNLVVRLCTFVAITLPLNACGEADKPASTSAQQNAKPARAKLPPAKEVIAKFVQAIGGKEAYDKIESQHAKGNTELPSLGVKGDVEIFAKRPNKTFVKARIPGIGDLWDGFDGKVAWSVNPVTGPIVSEGNELEQKREQALFNSVLHDEKEYQSMETLEMTQFEGRECYKLKLVRPSGREITEFYDTKSGLLVGFITTQESPVGPMTVTATSGEYKKFGDILVATKITQKVGPVEQSITINSVEFNKVPDSAFELPEQIKALAPK
ncbi:MAG: hypothetical protein FJ403_21655 [Verrucomicrobia bacterium]|nr:hypothetical protein [Verrucomicrobiota bacterium]